MVANHSNVRQSDNLSLGSFQRFQSTIPLYTHNYHMSQIQSHPGLHSCRVSTADETVNWYYQNCLTSVLLNTDLFARFVPSIISASLDISKSRVSKYKIYIVFCHLAFSVVVNRGPNWQLLGPPVVLLPFLQVVALIETFHCFASIPFPSLSSKGPLSWLMIINPISFCYGWANFLLPLMIKACIVLFTGSWSDKFQKQSFCWY